MGKINTSDKIMCKNQKRQNMEIKEIYIKFHLKDCFGMEFHSFLRRADAGGSADIIYSI